MEIQILVHLVYIHGFQGFFISATFQRMILTWSHRKRHEFSGLCYFFNPRLSAQDPLPDFPHGSAGTSIGHYTLVSKYQEQHIPDI
jgi:hypothetical protein